MCEHTDYVPGCEDCFRDGDPVTAHAILKEELRNALVQNGAWSKQVATMRDYIAKLEKDIHKAHAVGVEEGEANYIVKHGSCPHKHSRMKAEAACANAVDRANNYMEILKKVADAFEGSVLLHDMRGEEKDAIEEAFKTARGL